MKNICQFVKRVFLTGVIITLGCTTAMADKHQRRYESVDTVKVTTQVVGEFSGKKMLQSAFPVKLSIKGSTLVVKSGQSQMLPIYTKGGNLYLNIQLKRGVTRVSGLPRGSYCINNRTIRIS